MLVVVSERYRADPWAGLRRVRHFLGMPDRLPDELPERHVSAGYSEILSEADTARLRDLYAPDVAALKHLLGDALPEWEEFVRDEPLRPHLQGDVLSEWGELACALPDSGTAPPPGRSYPFLKGQRRRKRARPRQRGDGKEAGSKKT